MIWRKPGLFLIVIAAIASPHFVRAQNLAPTQGPAPPPDASPAAAPQPPAVKPVHESEITLEGLVSYGHYRVFAAASNSKVDDVGIEYDRHIWGHLFGSRVDYVGEIMPLVLLNQPSEISNLGIPESTTRKTIPGVDISPMGIRWLWRDGKIVKPYVMAKGGVVGFTQKALTSHGTYENFTLQSSAGIQLRLNDRYDLRLGLFGDFHFSNGFIVPANPGLDVMNATFGLTYHFPGSRQAKAR